MSYHLKVTEVGDPKQVIYESVYTLPAFAMKSQDYFKPFFRDLSEQKSTPNDRDLIEWHWKAEGRSLFQDLFPSELKKHLWACYRYVKQMVICSFDPHIPWELCRLHDGKEEGPFFCEAFEVVRVIEGVLPPAGLNLSKLAYVGTSELVGSVEELGLIRNILNLRGASLVEIEADMVCILTSLKQEVFDGIHLALHGHQDDLRGDHVSVSLGNGQKLKPVHIDSTLGMDKTYPLVFFNTCHGGRRAMALTGASGWADRLLKAGAGAFLSPLWAVPDSTARIFARAFYKSIMAGKTLARAVHEARAVLRREDPLAWLAYALYANPDAYLKSIGGVSTTVGSFVLESCFDGKLELQGAVYSIKGDSLPRAMNLEEGTYPVRLEFEGMQPSYTDLAICRKETTHWNLGEILRKPWWEDLEFWFVRIAPGTISLGTHGWNEGVPVEVAVTRPFWMARYPLTRTQYYQLGGQAPWRKHEGREQEDVLPVTWVSWRDAFDWIDLLNQRSRGYFSLPSEAQWVLACAPPTGTLLDHAWFRPSGVTGPQPVGGKLENTQGIHDMLGNVLEWCRDAHVPLPGGSHADWVGHGGGGERVCKGGWYNAALRDCTRLSRRGVMADRCGKHIGFRLAFSEP